MGALQAPASAAADPAGRAPAAWYCGCCGLVRPAGDGPADATAR